MAAALWLGAGSAVSRRAAGILWGLDGIDAAPIELSTTGRQRAPRKGILVHRVRTLVDDEIVTQKGIPVTSIPRTLLDLAGVVDREALELALESARRRRLLVRQDLVDQLRRSGRTTAGRGALRRLVEQSIPVATESALEAIVWRALVSAGLPSPIRQHDVHDEEGRFVARVDFAYPDALVAVEADGFDFHSGRAAFRRDRARQNALMRLGWSVYRITWQEVTQRADVMVAAVTELLALRGQAPS
jgi:very-short-patch-repair endonuclease